MRNGKGLEVLFGKNPSQLALFQPIGLIWNITILGENIKTK